MTFFDRKVDVAQFPSDHSLYVMCRAWMRNDPSGSSEEPVRPVSPQVVTVCTCLDITYVYTHACIQVVHCLLLFIHTLCICVYTYVYVCVRTYIRTYVTMHTYICTCYSTDQLKLDTRTRVSC